MNEKETLGEKEKRFKRTRENNRNKWVSTLNRTFLFSALSTRLFQCSSFLKVDADPTT
jgi:hypothetical protein